MKAQINDQGVLEIFGETIVEKMALTMWNEAWKRREAGLRIHVVKPTTEHVDLDPPSRPMGLDGFDDDQP